MSKQKVWAKEAHHLWLQHPIQGREFDLIFNDDSTLGDRGSGLKYVALAVVVTGPFIKILLHNHSINIK
jgi:hypothetical protein